MFKIIYKWQTFIGAAIGVMLPILFWSVKEKIREGREYRKKLYFMERLLVDQINNISDVKKTIRKFIDTRLQELIDKIKEREDDQQKFSIDYTFFPNFSVYPLSDEVHKIDTRSGYVDNKITRAYHFSKHVPHIIEDVKKQFSETVKLNRNIVLKKVNPPKIQKIDYLNNLERYKSMLEEELLDKSLKKYLKILVQAREALKEFRKMGLREWRFKFDPKYRFFKTKRQYIKAKKSSHKDIEEYFEKIVQKHLEQIE